MTSQVIGVREIITQTSIIYQGDVMLVKTPGDTAHSFDRATQVTTVDGRLRGAASEDYFAFVGPFGGATAATLLRAIMEHPERAGDPLSITVNLCAPVARGAFDLDVRLIKATRSTQHWMVELSQDDGVAAFATRRVRRAPPVMVASAGDVSWARRRSIRSSGFPTAASRTGSSNINSAL